MSNTLNLNDITARIRQYVSQIKEKKKSDETSFASNPQDITQPYGNELRSNLHSLDGESKFNIQNMTTDNVPSVSSEYAAEAYGHLSFSEEKHKVVIDFMHKNNRNFDVKA